MIIAQITTIGVWGRLTMAINAFVQTWRNPQVGLTAQGQPGRVVFYNYLRAWYNGTVFLPVEGYKSELTRFYRLYRHTRLLWNPVPNIINFWAGVIYPGNLSGDGLPFEDNKPTAIPFSDDITPELAAAIAQIMLWGNFQANKSVWPRYGAMMGSALMEIRDDLDARKVYLDPTQPDHVSEVELNSQGDVLSYALEYKTRDRDGSGRGSQEYTYRRVVTATQIKTFRNDRPFAYPGADGTPVPAVIDHPYPFCPAVWVAHQAMGGVFGEGAIKSPMGTLGSLAQINSMEARLDDVVGKGVEPLTVFITEGDITPLFTKAKDAPTYQLSPSDIDRESLPFLKAPLGTTIETISGNLNIGDARQHLLDKKEAFKQDYPEYHMYPQLRAMSQITGPAAEILLGDVSTPAREIRANYDRQLIKAFQMAVTVAAIRANDAEGGWPALGDMDPSRTKFASFDEQSYKDGQLDFEIMDRPLIPDAPLTEQEKLAIADVKVNKLEVPVEQAWEEMGYDEKTRTAWLKAKAAKEAAAAQALTDPKVTLLQAQQEVAAPVAPVPGK